MPPLALAAALEGLVPGARLHAVQLRVAGIPAAGIAAAGIPAAGVPAAGVPAAGVPAAETQAAGRLPARLPPAAACAPLGGLRLWLLDPLGMARPLTETETDAVWETPPYWSFCWGAGKVLAAHLLADPALVAGKTVVDFGCGSGVVGIAAALAGAAQVIGCDSDPQALRAAAANAALNGVEIALAASLDQLPPSIDLLCAADVLYDPANLPLAERFLELAATVLVADSRMPGFAVHGYREVAGGLGITEPDLGELDSVKQVRVYRALGLGGSSVDHHSEPAARESEHV